MSNRNKGNNLLTVKATPRVIVKATPRVIVKASPSTNRAFGAIITLESFTSRTAMAPNLNAEYRQALQAAYNAVADLKKFL